MANWYSDKTLTIDVDIIKSIHSFDLNGLRYEYYLKITDINSVLIKVEYPYQSVRDAAYKAILEMLGLEVDNAD